MLATVTKALGAGCALVLHWSPELLPIFPPALLPLLRRRAVSKQGGRATQFSRTFVSVGGERVPWAQTFRLYVVTDSLAAVPPDVAACTALAPQGRAYFRAPRFRSAATLIN